MRTVFLALAMGATAIGGVAYAAQTQAPDMPPPPPGGPMGGPMGGGMMRADLNHDGIVTRDEFLASEGQRFEAMDADHDGTVTPDERAAYRDAMRDRRIADGGRPPRGGADAPPPGGPRGPGGPGGGTMTRDQAMARAATRFDRMDANHDGRLDATELANMREMRHVDRREHDGGSPPPPGE